MRGKKITVVCSLATVVLTAWLPMVTAVAGGAMMAGCSSGKSDTRQDARTSERTEKRVEERHD